MKSELERIKDNCQRTANREGKPMVIRNLNRFQPLYVIRGIDPLAGQDEVYPDEVFRCYPQSEFIGKYRIQGDD